MTKKLQAKLKTASAEEMSVRAARLNILRISIKERNELRDKLAKMRLHPFVYRSNFVIFLAGSAFKPHSRANQKGEH